MLWRNICDCSWPPYWLRRLEWCRWVQWGANLLPILAAFLDLGDWQMDGFVPDCGISSAKLEIPQQCTKLSKCNSWSVCRAHLNLEWERDDPPASDILLQGGYPQEIDTLSWLSIRSVYFYEASPKYSVKDRDQNFGLIPLLQFHEI